MNDNALSNFGKKVKQLREEKGWSQEKLALDIEVDKSYIGRIERAERYPNLKTIIKLADALNVQVKDLFDI
ncbi:MAG: helix-turn-helix transcriptional regulator [bacterium]